MLQKIEPPNGCSPGCFPNFFEKSLPRSYEISLQFLKTKKTDSEQNI